MGAHTGQTQKEAKERVNSGPSNQERVAFKSLINREENSTATIDISIHERGWQNSKENARRQQEPPFDQHGAELWRYEGSYELPHSSGVATFAGPVRLVLQIRCRKGADELATVRPDSLVGFLKTISHQWKPLGHLPRW